MKRGVSGLATIASTAPFFGLFGSVLGIVNSFVGCGGEKSACMAALTERLSQAVIPTALGLLVAIPALWSYRHLCAQIEAFDVEMDAISVEILNRLSFHLGLRNQSPPP